MDDANKDDVGESDEESEEGEIAEDDEDMMEGEAEPEGEGDRKRGYVEGDEESSSLTPPKRKRRF